MPGWWSTARPAPAASTRWTRRHWPTCAPTSTPSGTSRSRRFAMQPSTRRRQMVDQQQAPDLAVHQSIVVEASQERAFEVFTSRLTDWWPLEPPVMGGTPAVAAVIEPRAGGRWYERSADGRESDWGRVLTWEPPSRVVLSWQISADGQADTSIDTEVEVRFTAEDDRRTRVDLEHRGLEAFGPRAQEMRDTFESGGGWPMLLGHFGAAAAS